MAKTPSKIAVYDAQRLASLSYVGMKGVDPTDIQPPRILLMSGMSKLNDFTTADGKHPAVGEYFHTGLNLILKDFECHFLMANKGKWTDRRTGVVMDTYNAVGCYGDNLALFGMSFRSSSFYALSRLFTIVKSQNRPMFSILCKVETKELTGPKGTWSIPVVRDIGPEKDVDTLSRLEELALRLDSRPVTLTDDEPVLSDEDAPPPTSPNNSPDDIPW